MQIHSFTLIPPGLLEIAIQFNCLRFAISFSVVVPFNFYLAEVKEIEIFSLSDNN